MNVNYLLQLAHDTITSNLEYDEEKGYEIANYLESSYREESCTLSLHTAIVKILLDRYIESNFLHPSLLGTCRMAFPTAAIKPVCQLISKNADELLNSETCLEAFQLLIIMDRFLLINKLNLKHQSISKKILNRKYVLDFIDRCSKSSTEPVTNLALHLSSYLKSNNAQTFIQT